MYKMGCKVQSDLLKKLIIRGVKTSYGDEVNLKNVNSKTDFTKNVPLSDYEKLQPYIQKMMAGESDVLWPGKVSWYAKSSGTTADRSKYLPITDEFMINNLTAGSWDASTIIYRNRPDFRGFEGKSLTLCGALSAMDNYENIKVGDVSAIMLTRMPNVGKPFFAALDHALLPNWDMKIRLMSQEAIHEDVVLFGGVPTWAVVLFDTILQQTGKSNMLEVWPDVKVYLHGGVGFDPYRKLFNQYFPTNDFDYIEVYNATEGCFAIQDTKEDGMLLLLNNDIYYEFIPVSELESSNPICLSLDEVEVGKHYAIVITTSAGLWRYMPGDTIKFVTLHPYRIKVTGRVKHFINVFGEEVIVSNTDQAIKLTCEQFGCMANEYTVGPRWLESNKRGGHEWYIEFDSPPHDLKSFALMLDSTLQKLNSDYEAKRYKNMALDCLQIKCMPKGTFIKWFQSRGKLGGQHKLPRLYNTRKYLDEIDIILHKERVSVGD